MYYLDTSAVRTLGKKLVDFSSQFPCMTSALTVMEIIAGIDLTSDNDFSLRKSALENLEKSQVRIKWVFHEQILSRAFGLDDDKHYQMLGMKLRRIKNIVLNCQSRSKFLETLENKENRNIFDHFVAWDTHISNKYTETEWSEIKTSLKKHQKIAVFDEDEIINMKKLGESLLGRHNELNYSMSIWSLASSVSGEPEPMEAYNNYDQSIDIFVKAFSIQGAKDISQQRTPGRNDGADLYHLLYINEGDTLISNDNRQSEYINDLKNRYGFAVEVKKASEF